jgi:hypothetical protein
MWGQATGAERPQARGAGDLTIGGISPLTVFFFSWGTGDLTQGLTLLDKHSVA